MPAIIKAVPGVKLALIGFGPEEPSIREEIRALGLESFVEFIGPVSQQKLPSYIASADLFVMPSIIAESGDREGLGVVLLESLACETPVICSDVGGVTDIVQHGKTGLIAKQRDQQDIAAQCIAMLQNDKLRRETAAAGRQMVTERFTWSCVARQFSDSLRSIPGLGGHANL